MKTDKKFLSIKVKIGFGICDLGGNLFFTIIGFYLLFFLTYIVKLAAGLAGTALMIGKIWDAVIDPAVGYLSDRTNCTSCFVEQSYLYPTQRLCSRDL